MKQIIIEIANDADEARIVKAFTDYNGYQPKVADPSNPIVLIDNPQTRRAFMKARLAQIIKDCVAAQEANTASETARRAATDAVTALVVT